MQLIQQGTGVKRHIRYEIASEHRNVSSIEYKTIVSLNSDYDDTNFVKRQFDYMRNMSNMHMLAYNDNKDIVLKHYIQRQLMLHTSKRAFKFTNEFMHLLSAHENIDAGLFIAKPVITQSKEFTNSYILNKLDDSYKYSIPAQSVDIDLVQKYMNYMKFDNKLKYDKDSNILYFRYPLSEWCSNKMNAKSLNFPIIDFGKHEPSSTYNNRNIKLYPDSKNPEDVRQFFIEFRQSRLIYHSPLTKQRSKVIKIWESGSEYFLMLYDIGSVELDMYNITHIIDEYYSTLHEYLSSSRQNLDIRIRVLNDMITDISYKIILELINSGTTDLYYIGYNDLINKRMNISFHPFRYNRQYSDIEYLDGVMYDVLKTGLRNSFINLHFQGSSFDENIDLNSVIGKKMNYQIIDVALKRDVIELNNSKIYVNCYKTGTKVVLGFVGMCYDLNYTFIDNRARIESKRSYVSWENTRVHNYINKTWTIVKDSKLKK